MPSGFVSLQEDETDGSEEAKEAWVSDRPRGVSLVVWLPRGPVISVEERGPGQAWAAGRLGTDVLCVVWQVAAAVLSVLRCEHGPDKALRSPTPHSLQHSCRVCLPLPSRERSPGCIKDLKSGEEREGRRCFSVDSAEIHFFSLCT